MNKLFKVKTGIAQELPKAVSNQFKCLTECGIAPDVIITCHVLKGMASKRPKNGLIFYWSKTIWVKNYTEIKKFQIPRVI